MSASLFYCNTVANRISSGYMNPAVGFTLGFQTKKYYFYMSQTQNASSLDSHGDPLWSGYWAPLVIGPFVGGLLAGGFFGYYQKKVIESLRDLSKPYFYEDLVGTQPSFLDNIVPRNRVSDA